MGEAEVTVTVMVTYADIFVFLGSYETSAVLMCLYLFCLFLCIIH